MRLFAPALIGLALLPGFAAAQTVLRIEAATGVMNVAAADVVKAEVSDVAAPTVFVFLASARAADLERITTVNVGQAVTVLVCGRRVSEPVIAEPLRSGALAVGAGSFRAANRMAEALTGRLACLEAAAIGFDD